LAVKISSILVISQRFESKCCCPAKGPIESERALMPRPAAPLPPLLKHWTCSETSVSEQVHWRTGKVLKLRYD
jgi:hypothetical protein